MSGTATGFAGGLELFDFIAAFNDHFHIRFAGIGDDGDVLLGEAGGHIGNVAFGDQRQEHGDD